MKILLVLLCFLSTVFANSNNSFVSKLYKEIAKTKKNNFLASPYSAETVLARVLLGSRGETADELRQVINTQEVVNLKGNDQYTLNSANRIYILENFTIKEEFKSKIGAEAVTIDFRKNVEAAETINSWVQSETNDKIQNLVASGDFDNYTRAVLLNVLYFKANWSTPFLLSSTRKFDFYKTPNEVVKADAMRGSYLDSSFLFFECSDLNAKFLELPFKGEESSMTFVLPNEKTGLSQLENEIDRVFLPHNLTIQWVVVQIPKFKIETRIDLLPILQNLGVKKLFNEKEADLSGIAGEKGDLFVNKVIQKSFLEVSEEGVEAAAATYVVFPVPTSGIEGQPKEFIADHPFIFYIKVKGVIVFSGKVVDPLQ